MDGKVHTTVDCSSSGWNTTRSFCCPNNSKTTMNTWLKDNVYISEIEFHIFMPLSFIFFCLTLPFFLSLQKRPLMCSMDYISTTCTQIFLKAYVIIVMYVVILAISYGHFFVPCYVPQHKKMLLLGRQQPLSLTQRVSTYANMNLRKRILFIMQDGI